MHIIKVKSKFRGWQAISEEDALEVAKHLCRGITTTKNDEELIAMINSRFEGVEFTLSQLIKPTR